MTSELTIEDVRSAVIGDAACFRLRQRLQPAGGAGDKLFPPTFGDAVRITVDGREHETKYAVEKRRIEGESRWCVLLDSVASQANRMEEALLHAWEEARLSLPIVRIDFTGERHEDPALDLTTMGGDGYLTALELPHRLADALLRDSLLDGQRFRASAYGRRFTEASPSHATPIYGLCPSALVFGMWDSTGPKGGQGAKFQRALVSEIVGVGVEFGLKTASRIDPVGIELAAGPVYHAADPEEEWTADAGEAQQEKGKPKPFSRKGGGDKPGRPSHVNHGNVMPSFESAAGGVTLDHAEQVTVLSLPALRRLRFPRDAAGKAVSRSDRREAEGAVRTALTALGIAAIALQREDGFDLRSRCALVPEQPAELELVDAEGEAARSFSLNGDRACALVAEAAEAAAAFGFAWPVEPIDLLPAPKLVELIRKSRQVAGAGGDGEGEG